MSKAKFSHLFNSDMDGITFIYFDCGMVQSLTVKDEDKEFISEFCVHMDSQDVDKLKSALNSELNENTVFTPKEMEIIKDFIQTEARDNRPNEIYTYSVDNYNDKPKSWTQEEWKQFLDKINE